MKLRCKNCGEIVDSGIENISNHVFEKCSAIREESVSDVFSIRVMPYMNFEVYNQGEE